jgi:hypothetical protein
MQIARIRVGAIVFSDHSFPRWGEHIGVGQEDRMFEFQPLDTNHNRYDLRAWGFGLLTKQYEDEAYGNGSLFVSKEDIIFSEEEAWDSIYKPAIPVVKEKCLQAGYYLVVDDNNLIIVEVDKANNVWTIGNEVEISFARFNTINTKWYRIDLHELLTHLEGA